MIIGLTGRVGVGKSTACDAICSAIDMTLIDLDILGHQVLAQPKTINALTTEFGTSIVDNTGTIIRAELGRIVFSDQTKLSALNAISHPEIKRLTHEIIAKDPSKHYLIGGALLHEIGLLETCDAVVLIEADDKIVRNTIGKKAAIGDHQRSLDAYRADATHKLINTFDQRFKQDCIALVEFILKTPTSSDYTKLI